MFVQEAEVGVGGMVAVAVGMGVEVAVDKMTVVGAGGN
jgi:hypothetical protein